MTSKTDDAKQEQIKPKMFYKGSQVVSRIADKLATRALLSVKVIEVSETPKKLKCTSPHKKQK